VTLQHVVNIEAESGTVVLRLTSDEAERLALAIRADHETISRAEYYILYGLSCHEVRVLADAVAEAAARGDVRRSVPLLRASKRRGTRAGARGSSASVR
jgi:hypothetical protein